MGTWVNECVADWACDSVLVIGSKREEWMERGIEGRTERECAIDSPFNWVCWQILWVSKWLRHGLSIALITHWGMWTQIKNFTWFYFVSPSISLILDRCNEQLAFLIRLNKRACLKWDNGSGKQKGWINKIGRCSWNHNGEDKTSWLLLLIPFK